MNKAIMWGISFFLMGGIIIGPHYPVLAESEKVPVITECSSQDFYLCQTTRKVIMRRKLS